MRILFLGDIIGRPGRNAAARILPRWRAACEPDIVIANGENAAAGMGVTPQTARALFEAGIDVITLGNHTFRRKEAVELVTSEPRVLRPANYPPGVPGRGYALFPTPSGPLAVVNLVGRIFMDPLDDPFQAANSLIPLLREQTPCILIDAHAEATSEKAALAWMLDGRVSAVIGTHTHIQTADERVLPGGTAFITDVGMVGPRDSVLGVKADMIIKRFLTHLPQRFEVADGPILACAVLVHVRDADGVAEAIIRLQEVIEPEATDG